MTDADRAFTGAIPEIYDRRLGPTLFEPYALDLARRFAGFSGALLETAAGTGRVTRALAAAAPQAAITATDLNAPMIERAAQLLADPRIRWQAADAQALPFTDRSFDAVVCQFGVMFFPDKAAGFAEARRVLRPGGRFVFNVWDRLEANDLSLALHEAAAALFPADPPGFLARTPFGWNDPDTIRAALAQAGFSRTVIETVALETPAASAADFAAGMCTGSPLRAELEARAPGGLQGVVDQVAGALARRFGSGPIAGRGQALVVTAA